MKKITIALLMLILTACTDNHSNTGKEAEEKFNQETELDVSFLELDPNLEMAPDLVPAFSTSSSQEVVSSIVLTNKNSATAYSFSNISIVDSNMGFKIKLNRCGSSLESKKSCQIVIAFSSRNLFNGTYNTGLNINAHVIQLSATVSNRPDPSSTGSASLQLSLNAPFVPLNNNPVRTLTISNVGDGTAQNLLLSLPADYFLKLNRCPSSLKPNESCSMSVSLKNPRQATTPSAQDPIQATVTGNTALLNPITNTVPPTSFGEIYAFNENDQYCVLNNKKVFCGFGNATNLTEINMSGALAGKTIKKLSAAENFACVIASDDKIYCWGTNNAGVLGVGQSPAQLASSSDPLQTVGPHSSLTAIDITVGNRSACAIFSNQERYCWGSNSGGVLGVGDNSNRISPTLGVNGEFFGSYKKIRITRNSNNGNGMIACAINDTDDLFCWGDHSFSFAGGFPGTASSSSPIRINTTTGTHALVGKKVKDITSTNSASAAITTENKVAVWGVNTVGEKLLGGASFSFTPTPISFLNNTLDSFSLDKIESGANTICSLLESKTEIVCWGVNAISGVTTSGGGQTFSLPNPIESFSISRNGQKLFAITNQNEIFSFVVPMGITSSLGVINF